MPFMITKSSKPLLQTEELELEETTCKYKTYDIKLTPGNPICHRLTRDEGSFF